MTKRKKFYDPYAELLDQFNRKGVRYVVIGMSGINYYAKEASETFTTQDFDIFVKPTENNIKKCTSILKKLGYDLSASSQKLQDSALKDALKHKKTILATDAYGITFELLLAVSGFTFAQMEQDATVFDVGAIPVKVARLSKLLSSKKTAGRDKDKLFLKRYEMLLRQQQRPDKSGNYNGEATEP